MSNENPPPGATGDGRVSLTATQHCLDIPPTNHLQGWRAIAAAMGIQVHPAAALIPPMSHDELNELGKDIKENGLRHGVVLWTPERPARGRRGWKTPKEIYLLDGCSRLEAIWCAHTDAEERAEVIKDALYWYNEHPGGARLLHSETDNVEPYQYVISANLRRRHLTREKRDQLLDDVLKARPELSNRAIGKIVKRDHKTVAVRRAEAEARGEIPHVEAHTDSKGRRQPARRLSQFPHEMPGELRAKASKESHSPPAIGQSADRVDALRLLDETIRLLSQRSAEVLALPRHVRLGRAMQVIDSLGIGTNDLVPQGRR